MITGDQFTRSHTYGQINASELSSVLAEARTRTKSVCSSGDRRSTTEPWRIPIDFFLRLDLVSMDHRRIKFVGGRNDSPTGAYIQILFVTLILAGLIGEKQIKRHVNC